MTATPQGIHHVTAIAGDAQRNLDFYSGLLGLRLVKRTVNFDDPGTYHLYYGDGEGHPGTIMTFFPWKGALRGALGVGQTGTTAFSVPEGSLGFWLERLGAAGVPVEDPKIRFDEEVIVFADPDGLRLELVADRDAADRPSWQSGPVASQHAIRSFYGVSLIESSLEATADLLTSRMGFEKTHSEGARHRFEAANREPASRLDVLVLPNEGFGQMGVGSVHHVAFRIAGDKQQDRWRQEALEAGLQVTGTRDRTYFRSIYFREPGGVLFEIATDPPGFSVDETLAGLGSSLKLPGWLEPQRAAIERTLPPLHLPTGEAVSS